MSGTNGKAFEFAAFVLSRHVPLTVTEIIAQTGIRRATAYRYIEEMQRHFPVDFTPGSPANPGTVMVRRSARG